jgi:glyoxylase-like metal-dependent hydrolase (beta-lactamase superfamily II)
MIIMQKIHEKIFLLKGFCNSYYINDKVKILIDAGADFLGQVDILILTHIHPDHVFYANKIKGRTGCKIFIGKGDDNVNEFLFYCPSWKGNAIEKFSIDKTLNGGEIIDSGNYKLEIIQTPGHTLGGISLYEKKHKILFSGDTIFKKGIVGRTDLVHSDKKLMDKTLKKLEKLDYEKLFAGHDY